MTAQMLFFDIFSEKDPHLNAVEYDKVYAFAAETTQILEYLYSNFAINRQHKQLNHAAICAILQ